MSAYFARRLLLMIPTFLGITFLVFAITRFVPGGPIDQMMSALQAGASEGGASGGQEVARIPPEVMKALEAHYHLDVPFWQAYAYWMADLLRGDLGTSYKFNQPVLQVITDRFPISVYFGMIGFLLAYGVCIPLGIAKAIRHGTPFDVVSSAIVFVGYSVPGWALGAALLVLLGGARSSTCSRSAGSGAPAGRRCRSRARSLTRSTTPCCPCSRTRSGASPPSPCS